jgi:hypothetical protein
MGLGKLNNNNDENINVGFKGSKIENKNNTIKLNLENTNFKILIVDHTNLIEKQFSYNTYVTYMIC